MTARCPVEIIAHRGASYDAPENTSAAVNLAWEQGADAVEVDVHLSRDGCLVVIHDDNTRRTGGLKKKVSEQTLAELQALDAGRWKHPRWAGEKIPTLEAVLAAVPAGKRLFVEIKCGPEFIPAFAGVWERSGKAPGKVVLIGFALPTMERVKAAFPELEVAWVAEFKRSWKSGRWLPPSAELIEQAEQAGLDALDLGARGPITPAFVQQVKAAGLKLYIWTVDAPGAARRLIAAGVDGLTTNRPGWLRGQLN